ncbi:MaoC family dehydratase [Mesorhizobium sp. CGMCC 1.15528]|uniref:MaoC family dehydratase n=1 Tax=Mesorhizobium zhangyense TaxID=1776730 RepID=A0A7C9V3L0_9HYPH|nr:MaoC family dehydratase [Mesorhizobium zhangyense]NGN39504.1 MaoC family dehydratase [Mesorhizobium zhangyense]
MSKPALTFATLKEAVGQELGVSQWTTVDQTRIDQFADCTGDHQWIHVDAERARRESPFRATIAHGFLTLSIIGSLGQEIGAIPENTQAAFNYGLDRVRFVAPVRAGTRVRLRSTLVSLEDRGPGQYLMKASNVIEIEGDERPALIADTLIMLYERRQKKAVC